MKLISEDPRDYFAIKMAAEASAKYGFVAMKVSDIGQCFIVPADQVYALSKRQSEEIEKKSKSLRRRVKK